MELCPYCPPPRHGTQFIPIDAMIAAGLDPITDDELINAPLCPDHYDAIMAGLDYAAHSHAINREIARIESANARRHEQLLHLMESIILGA